MSVPVLICLLIWTPGFLWLLFCPHRERDRRCESTHQEQRGQNFFVHRSILLSGQNWLDCAKFIYQLDDRERLVHASRKRTIGSSSRGIPRISRNAYPSSRCECDSVIS